MKVNSIIFAGSGHGGVSAFKSLQNYFGTVYYITDDEKIIKLARDVDTKINNFFEVDVNTVVFAGYMNFIPREYLKKKNFINTHPSLLPKYRGLHSLVWAMLNFEPTLGFSIHIINENMDDGPLLHQFSVKYEGQTSKQIMEYFDDCVEKELGKIVNGFLSGAILPKAQDSNKATWVPRRNLDDCIIDFNSSIEFIERLFKVLVSPYPLPIIKVDGVLYEVTNADFKKVDYYTHVGRVVNQECGAAFIKVSNGILIIKELRNLTTKEHCSVEDVLKLGKRL
jgi:methionyl-tRNA formyltransferase